MRRIIGHPGVQLFAVLLIVSLVAERRLLGASPLGGGALVPAWGGARGAVARVPRRDSTRSSVGSTASAPPYLAVVAALATVLGGQAWLAVDVLLLGCVPLAGLTAYLASRWLVTATPARVLLAASYALLPVATGAVAAGRLGTAVAFIVLPLDRGQRRPDAHRGAPSGAPRGVGDRTARRAGGRVRAARLGARARCSRSAAVAVRRWLVAGRPGERGRSSSWFRSCCSSRGRCTCSAAPSAFLSEAGLSSPGLTTAGLPPATLLALSPGGPGLPPVWVTAGLGVRPARAPCCPLGAPG